MPDFDAVKVPAVALYNPIPKTLTHYQRELHATLNRIGVRCTDQRFPGIEDLTRAGKMRALVEAVVRRPIVHQRGKYSLVLWPAFGLLDSIYWRRSRGRVAVVIHDPIPIRPLAGYGRISKLASRLLLDVKTPLMISHSADASMDLHDLLPRHRHARALHPILDRRPIAPRTDQDQYVLVAGQYKPTRDLELLRSLGPVIRELGARPRIVGRGWPADELPEWEIRDEFVSDDELSEYIDGAAAVLLPYQRFYQSGIVIRALEAEVPCVVPASSFTRQIFGPGHPVLVHQTHDIEQWASALNYALTESGHVAEAAQQYRAACDDSWRKLLVEAQ